MKTFKKKLYQINYNLKNEQIADLLVTDVCNYNCPFCIASYMINTDHKFLDLATLKEFVLPLLKEKKITHVGISGGEPSLNKDLAEICRVLYDNDYEINIASNGADFNILSKCSNYVNYISLSLNYFDAKKINELNEQIHCQLRVHGLIYKNHYESLDEILSLRDKLDSSIILDFSTLRTTNEWTSNCNNFKINASNCFTKRNIVDEKVLLSFGDNIVTKNGVIVKVLHEKGNVDIILRNLSVATVGEPTDKQLIITFQKEYFYGFNDLIKKYI